MNLSTTILLNAVPAFILLSAIEIVFIRKEYPGLLFKKEVKQSFYLGVGFLTISALTKGLAVYVFSMIYEYRFFTLPIKFWYVWVLLLTMEDFTFYWFHRLSHTVRVLWASHQLHHSSEIYTLTSTFRETWTGTFAGTFLFWGWMPLFGVEPATILFMKSVSMIYQFWLHTEKIQKMPRWFEFFFNTPSHHRVHHGSNEEYVDTNYGGILIIWDRLFGSFKNESKKPVYGLCKKINSNNVFKIAFNEWIHIIQDLKQVHKWKDIQKVFFNRP